MVAMQVALEDHDVGKMLIKYPWILSTSIQENYKEVLSFFDMEKVWNSSVLTLPYGQFSHK